jgi:putative membrane protein
MRRSAWGLTATLAAWALLFWWLLLSARWSLYLSTRTAWVVPVGAAILTIAAAGSVLVHRPAAPRDVRDLAVVVLPVVVVLALPPAALGSFAAGRRSSFAGANVAGSAEGLTDGTISLVDLAGAQQTPEGRHALAAHAGERVTFTGFVTRGPSTPAEEFDLTRFIVACCVADALSVQVRVVGTVPGRFETDAWVRVTGLLYPLGSQAVVQAERVDEIPRPDDPYLTP